MPVWISTKRWLAWSVSFQILIARFVSRLISEVRLTFIVLLLGTRRLGGARLRCALNGVQSDQSHPAHISNNSSLQPKCEGNMQTS